jgi:orotidine-5'-phosphate decarboxylase
MIPAEKIIIALDLQEEKKLKELLIQLRDSKAWVKIGMETFYSTGPQSLYLAKDYGLKVFLDLKLHDIPNTVEQAMKSLMRLPLDMLNLHASGGSEMMRRAADVVKSQASSPILIAVTQLTSTTEQQMNTEQDISGSLAKNVIHLAKLAQQSGCDGVVCSPLEVKQIKLSCGQNYKAITPGIRPIGADTNDQKRTSTPLEAFNLGSDYLVIGRPITGALNPKTALEQILKG